MAHGDYPQVLHRCCAFGAGQLRSARNPAPNGVAPRVMQMVHDLCVGDGTTIDGIQAVSCLFSSDSKRRSQGSTVQVRSARIWTPSISFKSHNSRQNHEQSSQMRAIFSTHSLQGVIACNRDLVLTSGSMLVLYVAFGYHDPASKKAFRSCTQ